MPEWLMGENRNMMPRMGLSARRMDRLPSMLNRPAPARNRNHSVMSGTEQLADRRSAGALHGKQAADNDDGDDDDVGLAVAQKRMAPLDSAQALDGRGDRDGGVRMPSASSAAPPIMAGRISHGATLRTKLNRAKMPPLVVVIGLHGDNHVLDRGHERHGPDDERKRS